MFRSVSPRSNARDTFSTNVCVRPDMGGSTGVPLQDRIKVWLETVPALLKHLDVEYVSLLSHSAGTMYGLNTLYYLRHLLHPVHPYAAFIGECLCLSESYVAS